jgi:hypothetical protein
MLCVVYLSSAVLSHTRYSTPETPVTVINIYLNLFYDMSNLEGAASSGACLVAFMHMCEGSQDMCAVLSAGTENTHASVGSKQAPTTTSTRCSLTSSPHSTPHLLCMCLLQTAIPPYHDKGPRTHSPPSFSDKTISFNTHYFPHIISSDVLPI